MGRSSKDRKAQAAWERIEALGGHGVWEPDTVIVSLANTQITDADLALFQDFPHVQTLDLSNTAIGDAGLAHVAGLTALEDLIVVGTRMTKKGLAAFQRSHPVVTVTTEPPSKGTVNRFTGEQI
jgi:hypothetical protein